MNSNSHYSKSISLILGVILSLVSSSCAAVQYGTPSATVMGVSETITGIKSALAGTPGTFLMTTGTRTS